MTTTPNRILSSEKGARDHRNSLLALVAGVPLGLLIAGIWSFVVGTSDFSGSPRVTGAQSLLYDAPGYVLILGAAGVSLVYAARALRESAHGAGWGVWASGLGVLVTVLMTSTVVVDTLTTPHSETWLWVVRAGSVVVALVAVFAARAWARSRRA